MQHAFEAWNFARVQLAPASGPAVCPVPWLDVLMLIYFRPDAGYPGRKGPAN